MTAVSALTEDWAAGFPTARWARYAAGTGAAVATDVAAAAGTLTLRPRDGQVRATTLGTYDLTGSALTLELPSILGPAAQSSSRSLRVQLVLPAGILSATADATEDAAPALCFLYYSRKLYPLRRTKTTAGTAEDVLMGPALPFDPTAHRWVQITEQDGLVRWRVSPDGLNWRTLAAWAPTFPITALAVDLSAGYWAPQEGEEPVFLGGPPASFVLGKLNVPPTATTDPGTVIALDAAPNVAVDVAPELDPGTFLLDVDQVDGDTLLAWSTVPGWVNVVCDVTGVSITRGSSRLQGVLTRAEAGQCTVTLRDTRRRFDPLANADAVHAGTPVRVRAWGYAPAVVPLEQRRNLVPTPLPRGTTYPGWARRSGTGGATTGTVGYTDLGTVQSALRVQWTTAPTAIGGGVQVGSATVAEHAIPVTAGQQVTGSLHVCPSKTQTLAAGFLFYNAAGATVTGGTYAPSRSVAGGTVERLTVTNTVPAGATKCVLLVDARAGGTLWAVGDALYASAAQVEAGVAATAYFDGTKAGTAGDETPGAVTYAWAGAEYLSASVERLSTVQGVERWDAVLFTGTIRDLPTIYPRDDVPLVTVSASDLIADLAGWTAAGETGAGAGAGDNLVQRAQRLLTETGLTSDAMSWDVDRTGYAVQHPGTALARPWDELGAAQDAELGRVWVDADNRMVVRARDSELSGPMRGTFSDVHGDADPGTAHCCIADGGLLATLGTEQTTNRAVGARRIPDDGVDPKPVPALVEVTDSASAARWGWHSTERRPLEVVSDEQTQAWADYLVAHQAVPDLRVDSITPAPSPVDSDSALAAWRAVCTTDLGDRWAVRYRPQLGATVDRGVGVLGIVHDITPDSWDVTFTTVDAPTATPGNPSGYFLLDASKLDSGDVLAPVSGTRAPTLTYFWTAFGTPPSAYGPEWG